MAVDVGARAEAVVVSEQCDIGYAQSLKDVALNLEFACHPEVCQVAAVENEVDVVAGIDALYGRLCLVVPPLRVADEYEAYGLLSGCGGFNAFDVLRVDVAFSVHSRIIGMVVYEFAGGKGQASEKERSPRKPKKYLVW